MKAIVTILTIGSAVVIGGCNKTEKVSSVTTTVHEDLQETEVEVEVENGEITVMINGEERSIGDLSEIMGSIDFEGGDGEMQIAIMSMIDDEHGAPVQWVYGGDDENVRMHMTKMMGDRGEGGGRPMMKMMMGGDGPPEVMREHMMKMMSGQGGDGQHHGEWREHEEHQRQWRGHEDRDIPEEHQFIEELSILDEISNIMTQSSMAMLGIHMIRDELEPEQRLEALERIIDEGLEGSTSRNAAMIVAIETLQELDRQDEAADLMVELVLTN